MGLSLGWGEVGLDVVWSRVRWGRVVWGYHWGYGTMGRVIAVVTVEFTW